MEAVPPGVVISILPEVPDATTAVISVAETTVKVVAFVPPKVTDVAPLRLLPAMVTVPALAALVGVNEVIFGAGIYTNPESVAVPSGVITSRSPLEPEPNTALMVVLLTTVKELAAVPPKLTLVALIRLFPVIVTVAPVPPKVGVKEAMLGMQFLPASLKVQPKVPIIEFLAVSPSQ